MTSTNTPVSICSHRRDRVAAGIPLAGEEAREPGPPVPHNPDSPDSPASPGRIVGSPDRIVGSPDRPVGGPENTVHFAGTHSLPVRYFQAAAPAGFAHLPAPDCRSAAAGL